MSKSQRTNNANVAKNWALSIVSHSNNKQLTTDGKSLFSYNLCIGKTIDGQKVVFDFTAPAGHMVSSTTSTHVGYARRYADQVMDVDVARHAAIIR